MLRRVQCTFQNLSLVVVVLAAVALLSCGGSMDSESVTGSSWVDSMAGPAPLVSDTGTVDASGKTSKVLLCHKGSDKWVPSSAVGGHLGHGDTLGSCSAALSCPCFAPADIEAAAATCSTSVSSTCSVGDPYYLLMSCDPGGSVPPSVLGIYLVQTSTGGYCSRNDVFGTAEQHSLTDVEYQACVDVIAASGYCL